MVLKLFTKIGEEPNMTGHLTSSSQLYFRPIVSGEYGQALLQTYETVYGPAIGSDVAFAVEQYAKAGGYFPHRDAGAEGLQEMQSEFGRHLRRNANRFSEDFGKWLAKHFPQRISCPNFEITRKEAAKRALDRTYSFFADHISLCIEHEQTVFASILEEAHAFLKSKPDTDSIKRIVKRSQHAQKKEIQMIQTVAEPCRALRARKDVHTMSELALGVSSVKHELINLHASRDWAYASILTTLASLTHEDADVGKVVASLEKNALSRTQTLAALTITAYRSHLVHQLEQIDREVLAPLEVAIDKETFRTKIIRASDTIHEISDLWDKKLIGLQRFLETSVPSSQETVADISHALHLINRHLGIIKSSLLTMKAIASTQLDSAHDAAFNKIPTCITRWRRITDALTSDTGTMPALEYAHFLGARIVMEAELPEGIDDALLRKIFDYPIGNAIDMNNKFPREYADGEEFEVVVTVRSDSIEIRDNGRGITPERLAEVRRAIAEGTQLESDHGGMGRGLAVDVGQNYLQKLFPNAPDRTSTRLTIDSTLGVGTVVTIHYPKSVAGTVEE